MDEEIKDGQEVHKTPEGDSPPSPEDDDTSKNEGELTPEEIKELQKKASASSQNFERAKKAEDELRKLKKDPSQKEKKEDGLVLSPKDNLALIRAEVEDEDLDEVLEYARFKKVSVNEALKLPLLKARLAELKQERATAIATQTKGGNRGQTKVSAETILAKAKQGDLPEETDEEGIAKLVDAEWEAKNKKR